MQSNARRRPHRRAGDAVRAAFVALLVASAVATTHAQAARRVTGTVLSSDGERLAGAQVRVVDASAWAAITDDDGRFEFFVVGDTGARALVVRRIGFRPESLTVRVSQSASPPVEVRLVRVAQLLARVVVEGDAADPRSISAQVHERQRRAANGYFVYREDIERMEVIRASEVLRRVPGVHVTAGGIGHADIRLRASACAPLFWMDGTPLIGGPFDIDQLTPSSIEAIEVYSSAGTVPVEFRGPIRAQGCGSIVIWTREGERRPRRARISADSIARLVDAARVFLPQEVDSEAQLVAMPQPEYPDSLVRAHAAGVVVAEFIVDAAGHIVPESIGVVTTSHVLFANAVRLALPDATFRAAIRRGHPVSQVMQLPVTFKPPPG